MKAIHAALEELNNQPLASKPLIKPAPVVVSARPKKYKPRAPKIAAANHPTATTPPDESEKPKTLAGAMKLLAKRFGRPFTGQELKDALMADKDFNAKLEETGPSAFSGNLLYWSTSGKISREGSGAGAIYTVIDLNF